MRQDKSIANKKKRFVVANRFWCVKIPCCRHRPCRPSSSDCPRMQRELMDESKVDFDIKERIARSGGCGTNNEKTMNAKKDRSCSLSKSLRLGAHTSSVERKGGQTAKEC